MVPKFKGSKYIVFACSFEGSMVWPVKLGPVLHRYECPLYGETCHNFTLYYHHFSYSGNITTLTETSQSDSNSRKHAHRKKEKRDPYICIISHRAHHRFGWTTHQKTTRLASWTDMQLVSPGREVQRHVHWNGCVWLFLSHIFSGQEDNIQV